MTIWHVTISRLQDGLPLVSTMETADSAQLEKLKKLEKSLLRKLAAAGGGMGAMGGMNGAGPNGDASVGRLPAWCSILAGDYTFQWVSYCSILFTSQPSNEIRPLAAT
jgi:hypothetical protein